MFVITDKPIKYLTTNICDKMISYNLQGINIINKKQLIQTIRSTYSEENKAKRYQSFLLKYDEQLTPLFKLVAFESRKITDSYNLTFIVKRHSRTILPYKKEIKKINKELTSLGFEEKELTERVLMNIDFARANVANYIHSQAILEGIPTTFPKTKAILDNEIVSEMRTSDILKIVDLKRAWEFILDKDVIASKTNYYLLCHIASIVNENSLINGGKIRSIPVTITGASYIPPIPIEIDVKEAIEKIVHREDDAIDIAIDLCLYCMKTQIFIDGNKRSSVIFANHYLVSQGGGLLIISEERVPKFAKLLVAYYDGKDQGEIKQFMKEECWYKF